MLLIQRPRLFSFLDFYRWWFFCPEVVRILYLWHSAFQDNMPWSGFCATTRLGPSYGYLISRFIVSSGIFYPILSQYSIDNTFPFSGLALCKVHTNRMLDFLDWSLFKIFLPQLPLIFLFYVLRRFSELWFIFIDSFFHILFWKKFSYSSFKN